MTHEQKESVFNMMFRLEKRGDHDQASGAWAIILALGLADEYIEWRAEEN